MVFNVVSALRRYKGQLSYTTPKYFLDELNEMKDE
jgi:hypothetical protein